MIVRETVPGDAIAEPASLFLDATHDRSINQHFCLHGINTIHNECARRLNWFFLYIHSWPLTYLGNSVERCSKHSNENKLGRLLGHNIADVCRKQLWIVLFFVVGWIDGQKFHFAVCAELAQGQPEQFQSDLRTGNRLSMEYRVADDDERTHAPGPSQVHVTVSKAFGYFMQTGCTGTPG